LISAAGNAAGLMMRGPTGIGAVPPPQEREKPQNQTQTTRRGTTLWDVLINTLVAEYVRLEQRRYHRPVTK
jgi:hypothetical protein